MLSNVEYGYFEMPALKTVLAEIAKTPGLVRVHIRSGAPRYWYCRRQIRRVHGTVRYKDGAEIFNSKSVTDAVREMKVARTVAHEGRNCIKIFVFSPYGHRKERVLERDPQTNTERWTVAEARDFAAALGSSGDDDELPF